MDRAQEGGRELKVIAHRGASGQAYENSASAFRLAGQLGADGVELDIHATQDGGLVVHHDPVIPGLGPIPLHSTAQIAAVRLPNGEPIPTLKEALSLLAGLDVWIEVKSLPSGWDAKLLATIDAGPTPQRYAVHGFDHRIIARLGRARPALKRGALLSSYLLNPVTALSGTGASVLWMEAVLIDRELVRAMHADDREVIAWTVNTETEVERLAALGVDGLCGNYPDRIRATLGKPRA